MKQALLTLLIFITTATTLLANADFTGDGKVDFSDHNRLKKCLTFNEWMSLGLPLQEAQNILNIVYERDCQTIKDLDGDGVIDWSDHQRLELCLTHIDLRMFGTMTIEDADAALGMNFEQDCDAIFAQ